jgi:hypothetical protein
MDGKQATAQEDLLLGWKIGSILVDLTRAAFLGTMARLWFMAIAWSWG